MIFESFKKLCYCCFTIENQNIERFTKDIGVSVNEINVNEINVNEINVNEINVNEINVNEINVNEINVNETRISINEKYIQEKYTDISCASTSASNASALHVELELSTSKSYFHSEEQDDDVPIHTNENNIVKDDKSNIDEEKPHDDDVFEEI